MSEEDDLETRDLQEALEELHEEKAEHEADEKKLGWVRYIGLSTAVLAVFAAMGALQSGSLINEALINQVKASDSWNEYQASREKTHLYTVAAHLLIDSPPAAAVSAASHAKGKWAPEDPKKRAREYEDQVAKEDDKAKGLSKKAEELQKETEKQVHRHHFYAYSVALIQVAIALSAIAALARVKYVWYLSMGCGLIGIVLFFMGLR
jgi:hypothetical protein